MESLNKAFKEENNSRGIIHKKYHQLKISKRELTDLAHKNGYDSYKDFMMSRGLGDITKVSSKDYISFLVDPDEYESDNKLQKLASNLGIEMTEFYGIVQLEGDEPDASNNYDMPIDNGLTTMEMKRRERRINKEDEETKAKDKEEKRKEREAKKNKKNNKATESESHSKEVKEVTSVANIPSKMGAVDIMTTPIQKSRKKVNF